MAAANNYRAGGGGNFPDINEKVIILVAPGTSRDVIARFIVEQGTINPSADSNWSFAPVAGASVIFPSGPRAKDHLADVKGIEYVGDGDGGFANFRVKL